MAANTYITIVGWMAGLAVAVGLSLITEPRPESELEGLVFSLSPALHSDKIPWHLRPGLWGVALLAMLAFLMWAFW
jgi:SSS family solute:Na+ symporter